MATKRENKPTEGIINAFHPDYVKTYHPNLMNDLRIESRQTKNGQAMTKHVAKVRETNPSHGTVFGISNKVAPTPSHVHRAKSVSLELKQFHVYAKAGPVKIKKK